MAIPFRKVNEIDDDKQVQADMSEHFFKFKIGIIEDGVWAELSLPAKAIYPVICGKISGKQCDRISRSQLTQLSGIKDPHTIANAITELEQKGLIFVEKCKGKISQYRLSSVTKPHHLNESSVTKPHGLNHTSEVKPVRSNHTTTHESSVMKPHTTLDINQSINQSIGACEKFAMHADWQPDDAGKKLLQFARIDLSTPENEAAFAEFLGYWSAKAEKRTQAEWNNTLLRNFSSGAQAARKQAYNHPTDSKQKKRPSVKDVPEHTFSGVITDW